MSADGCEHEWGPVEEVELGLGTVHTPLCKHCGAAKLEVGRLAARRTREAWAGRLAPAPEISMKDVLPDLETLPLEEQGRLAL